MPTTRILVYACNWDGAVTISVENRYNRYNGAEIFPILHLGKSDLWLLLGDIEKKWERI